MHEYDRELDWLYFQSACLQLNPHSGPGPWEWEVCHWWSLLSPFSQSRLVAFARLVGMELHVFGPTLAIIYNPQRPTRWSIIKRILHDTFRSPVRED